MATKYPIIKHRAFFQNFNRSISPIHTGRILMKLRMDIPVHHTQCVSHKKKEHRSKVKVKVTENTKTTIWAITFEPEVVETSGCFHNFPCQNTCQKSLWCTTYGFCVTWRQIKYTIVAYFLTSSILNRLISKSVHTLIWPVLYTM